MPVVIPPAGLSPAGFFVPQTFAAQGAPPAILSDAIDPSTGEYLSIFRGMHPIDAQVIDALSIVRRSGAAVLEDGQEFKDIKKIDDTTGALVESKIRRTLKLLADNRDIEILSITEDANSADASAWGWLKYRNLRTKGRKDRSLRIIP